MVIGFCLGLIVREGVLDLGFRIDFVFCGGCVRGRCSR
jgi:hypothetical protein